MHAIPPRPSRTAGCSKQQESLLPSKPSSRISFETAATSSSQTAARGGRVRLLRSRTHDGETQRELVHWVLAGPFPRSRSYRAGTSDSKFHVSTWGSVT